MLNIRKVSARPPKQQLSPHYLPPMTRSAAGHAIFILGIVLMRSLYKLTYAG